MDGQNLQDGPNVEDWAALLGRMLLVILFFISGFGKIGGFQQTSEYIAAQGLPFPQLLTAIAIVLELGGAIAVAIGWKTRWVAAALMLFMIVITPVFHKFWGIPPEQAMEQQINFMKNVAILGGFLLLFAHGPGRYSLDER
jgi:putative oxidoreductase